MLLKRQSLLRSTSLISIMTFFSRLMGFVRDMLLAFFFGTHAGIDAFYVAFRIPNFMRRLFAEGAFAQAFVPVLAEYQQTRSAADVRLFMARIAGHLSAALSIVTILGILASPFIIFIFAPGFEIGGARNILATEMLRLTFPYLMLVSLTAMAGAVLNTYGYYGVPAFTPVLLNISMIVAAIYLRSYFAEPVVALAWGVLIAGVAQLLFQIPFLYHRGLLVKPRLFFGDEGVTRVIKLMVPALFGVSIVQLNLMVDSIFASFLQVGSVSWLYYTDRLTDFPLGVFGVAIATVILPHLARRHTEKNQEKFTQALDWGLRSILLVGLPAGISLALFAMPLICCCFAYGEFGLRDVLQTQKSLIALALGVPAFMMIKVLASAFYAQQDINTPVKIGAIAMIFNSIFCALFILPLAHAGLALASALAGYINCGSLLFLLIRRNIFKPREGWGKFILQLLFANGIIAIYLLLMTGHLDQWLIYSAGWRVTILLAHVLTTIIIYLISLYVIGVRPSHFRGLVKE